jgi:non-ribosomal peptide synthetase component F
MIEDAAVGLLLTQKHWSEFISGLIVPTLTVDANELDAGQAGNPGRTILPDNIAYLTYTSGSTGQPKGIGHAPRGIELVARTNYADFSREHVFMLAAPLTFDASTFEIWGALLNGRR